MSGDLFLRVPWIFACCNMLQCVAVCCVILEFRMLQYVAVCCIILDFCMSVDFDMQGAHATLYPKEFVCVAVGCSIWHYVAVCCSVLQ